MNFLKDHFEKLILGLVLLVSAGGIFFVIQQISASKETKEAALQSPRGNVRQYQSADLQPFEETLQEISQPIVVGITGDHELLNPVRWKEVNGVLARETELGVKSLAISEIKPLNLRIAYLRTTEYGKADRFVLEITNENEETVGGRKPTKRTFEVGNPIKGVPYTLQRVDGPSSSPTDFYVTIKDENTGTLEHVQFTPDKPYQSVVGYSASFVYEPTGKKFVDQRVNGSIKIDDSTFIIVAITENQATLENKSGKRTTLDFNNNR